MTITRTSTAVLLVSFVLVPAALASSNGHPASAKGEPPSTGSMYNGNNTRAPKLQSGDPMATATERMQVQPTGKGSNLGGNSTTGRAGNNG